MPRRTGPILILLAVLAAACGPRPTGTPAQAAPASKSSPRMAPDPRAPTVAEGATRWEELEARIPNRQSRMDKAIGLLEEAKRIKAEGDKVDGAARKELFKKAKAKYEEAGTVYDQLQMDVMELDERLWDRRFASFQRKWDSLSKDLKRLGF